MTKAEAVRPLLLLLLAGCQEYAFTSNTTIDTFQQRAVNAVDMLVVIDNSCSMVEEQDNLARNFDSLIDRFQEANVDWRLAVTTTDTEVEGFRGLLMGGDDEVIIRGPAGDVDRVAYDRDWPFETGTSLQLGAEFLDGAANDGPEAWCPSTATFGKDGHGSPGLANGVCDGGDPVEPDGGRDEGPRTPLAGDLVISEIMPRPPGNDASCEWVELTSLSPSTLDLAGIELLDDGRDRVVFPPGTLISPRGLLVVGRSAHGCGATPDVVVDARFSLNDDIRVIGPGTPAADEIFSELVAQGTTGSGIEMGLEAARLALSEPWYSEENGAWLREDATLSLLIVSDEDDMSPRPVHEYIRTFTDLKGDQAYRDRRLVNLSAVVADLPPPRDDVPSCSSETGEGWYGERYIDAAATTEGLVESICADDFAPIVSELGLTLSGLEVEFALSRWPRLSSLVVALYADDSEDGLVRELVIDLDFTYVADGNLLRFEADQVPPAEHWITAEYEVLPDSVGGDT